MISFKIKNMKLSSLTHDMMLLEDRVKELLSELPDNIKEQIKQIPENHYQQWAAIQILNDHNTQSVIDAVKYYRDHIRDNRYQEILKQYTSQPRNILSVTLYNVKDAQQQFDEKYAAQSKRSLKKINHEKYKEIIADEPGLKIIKIKGTEDDGPAKLLSDLAKGTKWCVSDIETGKEYLSLGPIFFILLNNEKYLCSIDAEQFMDASDKEPKLPVDTLSVLNNYVPGMWLFAPLKSDLYKNNCKDHPSYAYEYAKELGHRFLEGEKAISEDPMFAYKYAKFIIKGRWPEGEESISTDSSFSYAYAKDVIKGKWKKGERAIGRDERTSRLYNRDVLGLNY